MVEATVGLVGSRKWLVGRRCFYFEFILDLHEILLLVIVLSIFLLFFFRPADSKRKNIRSLPKTAPNLNLVSSLLFKVHPPPKKQPNLTNIFGMVWNCQLVLKVPPPKKTTIPSLFFLRYTRPVLCIVSKTKMSLKLPWPRIQRPSMWLKLYPGGAMHHDLRLRSLTQISGTQGRF